MTRTAYEAPGQTAFKTDLARSYVLDEETLAAMEGEWQAVFAQCERPSACASHAWAIAWWQAFGKSAAGAGRESRLFVIAFRDVEGRLVGIAPLYEVFPSQPWKARLLRPLGFVGQDGVFDMTEEPTFLAPAEWEEAVLASLAGELRLGLESGRWDAASFRIHGRSLKDTLDPLASLAWVRTSERLGSDYADLPATWAEYRKAMTRSMRDNLPYYPRLLTRDGHDWRVRLLRAPEEMDAAAVRLGELHRARAESCKGQRHDAHVQGVVQEAFLSVLLRRMASEGRATVGELLVGDEVVASQAFIEVGDAMMVYYSGYREAWYRYSPVFVIDAVVFKDALERGVRRLDFLRNPAPWKTRWLAAPGPAMHRAQIVSRRPASAIRYALFWTEQNLKRNVVARAPILARRVVDQIRILRTTIERAMIPALPLASRIGMRIAPSVHWAVLQAPLHHR